MTVSERRSCGRLAGKTALITGAGSGIGRASALLFAGEGATVVVADVDEVGANATVEQIGREEGNAVAHTVDVGDLYALKELARRVEQEFGTLHVLFNHAGIPGPLGLDFTVDDWSRVIDVNMRSGVFLTNYLLGSLRAARGASVIFTSSVSGLVGSLLRPVYSLSKSGLIGYTKALAVSLATDEIRVNAICPGPTDTPMRRSFSSQSVAGDSQEDVARGRAALFVSVPAGRVGEAAEVATAALFLASDEATYITGVALPVDGGYTAR
jgi:NAD(P)-dependent dehydrogenase (short-subunit alcohol dehydrogenase family)